MNLVCLLIEISSGMSREEGKGESVRLADETFKALGKKPEEEPVLTSPKHEHGKPRLFDARYEALRIGGDDNSQRVTQQKDRRRNRASSERIIHENDKLLAMEIQTSLPKSTHKNKGGRSAQLEEPNQLSDECARLRIESHDTVLGVMDTNGAKPRQGISRLNPQPPPYVHIRTQFAPVAGHNPYRTNQGQHGVHQGTPQPPPYVHVRTQFAPVSGHDPYRINQGEQGNYQETPRLLPNTQFSGQYSRYPYYKGPPGPHGSDYKQ